MPPLTKIVFCHEPAENVEKVSDELKRTTVRGRINRTFFSKLAVNEAVDWDGYVFIVTYIGQSVITPHITVCDIEMVSTMHRNCGPENSSAKQKIADEAKAAKALKLAKLKDAARERRRIKKEQEQKLIDAAQQTQQSTIGSLEL